MQEQDTARRRPTGRPGHNAGRTFPVELLTPEEVAWLMAAMNKGATGDRNRALVTVLYRAGLRVSEALALKAADVDMRAGSIRVLRGKGSKARTVGIDEGGLLYVERWINRRKKLGLNGRSQLFCQLDGSTWTPQAVREMLRYAASKAGIDKRVHPHGFRHSHAAHLAMQGVPTHVVQKQLGHASLAVTSRYLDHVAPADVVKAVRAIDWGDDPA